MTSWWISRINLSRSLGKEKISPISSVAITLMRSYRPTISSWKNERWTRQNRTVNLIIKQQKVHEFFVQYGLGTRSDFPKIIASKDNIICCPLKDNLHFHNIPWEHILDPPIWALCDSELDFQEPLWSQLAPKVSDFVVSN